MTRSRIATPEDARDLPGDFGHQVPVEVRFADTDAMGHVNNAVYLAYCEMARIRYWSDVTGEPVAAGHECPVAAGSVIRLSGVMTLRLLPALPDFGDDTARIVRPVD